MNQAAIMNGRSLVLGLVACLLVFNVAQAGNTGIKGGYISNPAIAGIALDTYISPMDVLATLGSSQSDCTQCSTPLIQPVLGDDNSLTPYIYTYCDRLGGSPRFSLSVGKEYSQFFETPDCDKYQFVALDASKSTYAAQFYWDCKQFFIYKCKGYLVFDQPTGRCVQGGYLKPSNTDVADTCNQDNQDELPGLSEVQGLITGRQATAARSGASGRSSVNVQGLPLTAIGCESLVRDYVPSYCGTCKNPLVQTVIPQVQATSPSYPLTPFIYTLCADNGRFSLDIINDDFYHTFFAPDCRGKTVVAIDPTRTTVAAKLFWDCTYGLILCPDGTLFDSQTNSCTFIKGDPEKLKTGLDYCPKTCGAAPTYLEPYASPNTYSPAIAPPRVYSSPVPGPTYGK